MSGHMRGRRAIVIGLTLVAAIGVFQAAAQAAAQTQPVQSPEWIWRAIAELGDVRGDVREAARTKLWSAGRLVEPALTEALSLGDPEIASAAREILIDFRCGLTPDTPRGIADQIRLYRAGNIMQKRAVVQSLLRMGETTYPYLARLSLTEPDAALRPQVFGEVAARGTQRVMPYLAEGDEANAQRLLEMAMSDGSDRNVRNYAAYMTLCGRGDESIAELRQQIELTRGGGAAAQILAYLYRAKGDLKSAVEFARMAKDPDLLDGLLLEAGEWKELAELHNGDASLTDIERLGFLAAYQRLAGDQQAFKATIGAILGLIQDGGMKAFLIAESLFLNDRPDDAIIVLRKNGEMAMAFDLLATQQNFEAAIKLAEEAIAANGPESGVFEAKLARLRYFLGQKQQAIAACDKLATSLENRPDPAAAAELIGALVMSRQEDRAQALAAAVLARNDADPGSILGRLFADRDPSDLLWWYRILKRLHGDEKPAQLLARLREIHAQKLPIAELETLAAKAADLAMTFDNANRDLAMRAVAQTLLESERFDAAEKILRRLASSTGMPADYMLAGDAIARGLIESEKAGATSRPADEARRNRWLAAAELYAQASQRDRTLPAAVYLRGHALAQAGRMDEGQRLMKTAVLLPLAHESMRYAFAESLRRVGLEAEAQQQDLVVVRTGAFLSWELGNALRREAARAEKSGDYATAADCLERSNLECLQVSTSFRDATNYLTTTYAAHRLRALTLLKEGNAERAVEEGTMCLRIVPGHIDVVIDLWPELLKAGRKAEAEKLFGTCMDQLAKLLERYPDSATLHNSVAWLRTRCRQDLNDALTHALKGVELDPKNTAIIDTLAETYFQLGQRDKAAQTIRRCIELEPNVPRHKEALRRFEQLSPDTNPPPG